MAYINISNVSVTDISYNTAIFRFRLTDISGEVPTSYNYPPTYVTQYVNNSSRRVDIIIGGTTYKNVSLNYSAIDDMYSYNFNTLIPGTVYNIELKVYYNFINYSIQQQAYGPQIRADNTYYMGYYTGQTFYGSSTASTSLTTTAAVAPTIPQNLSASFNNSTQIATISWSAPSSNGGLSLTYSITAINTSTEQIITRSGIATLSTTFSMADFISFGASKNTTISIQYSVMAINDVGSSESTEFTPAINHIYPPSAPGAVTALVAIANDSNEQYDISWNAPVDTGGQSITYTVSLHRVSDDVLDLSFNNISNTFVSYSYSSLSIAKGETKYYRTKVTTVNATGTSVATVDSQTDTLSRATTAPGPITALSAIANDSTEQYDISWNAPTDSGGQAVSYSIFLYNVSTNAIDLSFNSISATSVSYSYGSDLGIQKGVSKQYNVRIVATNATGSSPTVQDSGSDALTRATTAPGPITALSAIANDSTEQYDISWNAPTDNGGQAVSYSIFLYNVSTNAIDLSFNSISATSVSYSYGSDLGIQKGVSKQYNVRIVATNATGSSPTVQDSGSDALTRATTAPDTPSDLIIEISNNRVFIGWTDPTDMGQFGYSSTPVYSVTILEGDVIIYDTSGITVNPIYLNFYATEELGFTNPDSRSLTFRVSVARNDNNYSAYTELTTSITPTYNPINTVEQTNAGHYYTDVSWGPVPNGVYDSFVIRVDNTFITISGDAVAYRISPVSEGGSPYWLRPLYPSLAGAITSPMAPEIQFFPTTLIAPSISWSSTNNIESVQIAITSIPEGYTVISSILYKIIDGVDIQIQSGVSDGDIISLAVGSYSLRLDINIQDNSTNETILITGNTELAESLASNGGGGGAPCFLGNAPVLTPHGYKRIDSLKEGDVILTPDRREVAIQRISRTIIQPGNNTNPYIIPAGLFGAISTLPISPRHRVMISGRGMIEAQDIGGLRQLPMRAPWIYYNIVLPDWSTDNMIVSGVEVESLAPVKRVKLTIEQFKKLLIKKYGTDWDKSSLLKYRIFSSCRYIISEGMIEAPVIRNGGPPTARSAPGL